MSYTSLLVVLFLAGCFAAPADNPVHVELPVYDQPQAPSDVQLAHPLELENHPGVQLRTDKSGGLVGNLISQKLQAATSVLGKGSQGGVGIFANPVSTRERALLETEGWGSKTLSIKENLHNVVAGIFQPKPIVDTIKEEEKYGNSGDKFYAAGRAVVGGAEGVSNLVNSVLEVPGNIFRKITRAASEKLNNLGGRLIGLN
ncbi:uncharacterized protein LOC126379963 [Pectinophora gossypiella]|uniref:uncharacterized protein LOC126379963 n=1 Tax=Pectinophora gossypiella TaxID=13191 RepID=UPI00214ECCF0|nr:uncharacterized protein LOC126379963 [Pectinophora gossypiella]